MLAQTVLHLFRQHQLLLVELKEDLQVPEVALVLFLLHFTSVAIDNQTSLVALVIGKDCLRRLVSLSIVLFLLYAPFHLHLSPFARNLFLPSQLFLRQVCDHAEAFRVLFVPVLPH